MVPMNENVVQFGDYKPHAHGPCVCSHCGHRWFGVMPLPVKKDQGFQCPSCHRFFGFLEYPIGGHKGDENYICNCGSAFFVVQRGSITCGICGTTHLNVLEQLQKKD